MDKRYVGIDLDARTVRVAILEQGAEASLRVEKRDYETPEELTAALRELIGETRLFRDRLAAALPALEGFVRRLHVPFADPKKIESILPFELSARIPVPVEECLTDFQKPGDHEEEGFPVMAAAVRTETVGRLVETFDGIGIPLHFIDLAPFAYARGLKDGLEEGILACLTGQETTISLIVQGRIKDYRVHPAVRDPSPADLARLLLREKTVLQREAKSGDLPLFLLGSEVNPTLLAELEKSGQEAGMPGYFSGSDKVEPEYLPAVALALRASAPAREKDFNFRRGPFTLRNEWTALKREMIAAALLVLFTGLLLAGSAWLKYAHKAGEAEALREEMVRVYKQTFPGAPPGRDIPMLMKSRIGELNQRGQRIGLGQETSPLVVMQEISRNTPEDVTVDMRELSFTPDSIRLDGRTTSFDAINQMARQLQQSSLFRDVQIADAKMSLDGNQVDFRLNLLFRGETAQ